MHSPFDASTWIFYGNMMKTKKKDSAIGLPFETTVGVQDRTVSIAGFLSVK